MFEALLVRRASVHSPITQSTSKLCANLSLQLCTWYNTAAAASKEEKQKKTEKGRWLILPPVSSSIDAVSVVKALSSRPSDLKGETTNTTTSTTALKWVLRCCPHLPRSLVQKLFRLRQVRRESCDSMSSLDIGNHAQEHRLKRVTAKEVMNLGDRIFLPITVQELPSETQEHYCNEDEISYICSLELYKDPAIIAVNKPHGMPVQGGIGIKKSLDELAATYLRYDYSEPPRLVHRLDRDSSGILVMGRTQTSATILHSIFREKTFGASINVVLDDGKSERMTVDTNGNAISSQHAVTKYQVMKSSAHGYTWLELCPLTGRKHQLRVHCAEVLGTPIVGDYKYGWQAHRKWKPLSWSNPQKNKKLPRSKESPFGLDSEGGSIAEKQPHLHLHCRQMIFPNIALALQHLQSSSNCDLSELESLNLVAPLPPHMQRSWGILCF
ncbi:PREDICTED: RNA pseudouridine synthase 4, mitochondrial-like isoform X2 [Nelumbo nucifera]|uniref:RNA pseudouridine synthase 4, mitochondrial-like isoform X2 n=1 Tax=Nelumbo nucifera TaxID=4432 RepID=A0A1U8ATQ0_NELNU|nr:PREDICTED: RNA pseudouridine synthase 4, mitochondrial-like isoform X2 [Nelumbo nucifera]